MNRVQIIQTGPTASRVVINGTDISDSARAVDVSLGAGDLPDVTVHAHAWPDIDLDSARVRIVLDASPDTVREMLSTRRVDDAVHQAISERASADRLLELIATAMTEDR